MLQDQTPYPWKTIGLAVLPGAIYLATPLIIAGNPVWQALRLFWLGDALTLVTALVVISVGIFREKRLPLWTLFAVGLAAFALLQGVNRASVQADMTRDEFEQWYSILSTLALIVAGVALLGGALAARRDGAAAALIAAGLIGVFVVDLFDPTYGLLIIAPDRFSPLGVRLIDLIAQVPLLIVLPALVLRARSERGQVKALLGGYGLSLLVILLLSLIHDFALERITVMPLTERLLYAFTIRPLIMAIPWVMLAVITLVYSRLKRGDSAPPDIPMALRPEPAP